MLSDASNILLWLIRKCGNSQNFIPFPCSLDLSNFFSIDYMFWIWDVK